MSVRLSGFHPAVAEWFAETFPGPTRAQERGWPPISAGQSALILAPTGSGKTLAAFLWALDRLMFEPTPGAARRCRVVYVSPLRALAVDVERNLRSPLNGIARVAARRGDAVHLPEVAVRTGDTPAVERSRMARRPPDILITTPESLFLLLTSQAEAWLSAARTVIVDEIHALVGTKRGAHLALSLERLQEKAGGRLQRIGLSATQRPLDVVARYLGGFEAEPGKKGRKATAMSARPVTIVDAGSRKAFELTVEVPVADMARLGEPIPAAEIPEGPAEAVPRRSIWPALHGRLLELIRAHRTTLVFVNSRRLAERLSGALNEVAGEEISRAHHGSIAREQRLTIEDALKAGELRCLVATSSLELGIDMGSIDLVVQVEAPPSVASGMQRIGRAGHQAEGVSRGVVFPKFRGDLLAAAAAARGMHEGAVEPTRVPRNPLDVLAQQLVAVSAMGERGVGELFDLCRRADPFQALPRAQLEGVLDMLSGRYPSDEFAELRPRLVWDRRRDRVRAREGAKRLVVANAGTIPDRGLYGVFLAGAEGSGRRVGELDEEMVFESREGEVFVLGASSWRIAEITRDRVLVEPAPGEPGRMPFWKGDRPARPVELSAALGRLTRDLREQPRERSLERLQKEHGLDALAASNLVAYVEDQVAAVGAVPDDRTLVLERSRDEMGDWRLCLLSPWGGRVHAPWSLAIRARLRRSHEAEAETLWSDDGIVVRWPDRADVPDARSLLPEPEEIEDLVVGELGRSPLFAAHFREAAARALLLPRRRPGLRSPLWQQRKRASDLLAVASRYGSFPVLLEAYRECLQDVFDLPALVDLARRVQGRQIRLVTVDAEAPSPFAASLLFGYVANYLYDGDAPLGERRAQALTVDQAQLRELLGEAELRQLLDPQVIAELERERQGLRPGHRARNPDQLHELLQRLGDLSAAELAARVEPAEGDADGGPRAEAWTEALLAERRVIRVRLGGQDRLAAAEDAGKLRDAFGVALPRGLPAVFLAPSPHALDDVLARFARGHGPFVAAEPAARYATAEAAVEEALGRLLAAGRILEGEFRPGGAGREWCDPAALAVLRRRSLFRLRREVEPAETEALARLMLDWQGVGATGAGQGPDALLDVVEQLQGAELPASALEADVLPSRLPGYRPEDLDALCAAGEVVWVGAGALGDRDGRVRLFLAQDLWLLRSAPAPGPTGGLHEAIRSHLGERGASFFGEIQEACGEALPGPVVEALWDLAWAGEVTSDAFGALRSVLRPRSAADRVRRRPLFRSRRQAPPTAIGRWSLLRPPARRPTPTERARALAEQLLARHGVLSRTAVLAEEVPGGFAALYPVLRALEEAGRVRRGYFVAGLGGSQFAVAGAVDRLRAVREAGTEEEPRAFVLAATDPGSPYGAALPWPRRAGGRPQRSAGSHVVLVDGALVAWLGRGEREAWLDLPAEEPVRSRAGRAAASALAAWVGRAGRGGLLGWESSGEALSALAPYLHEAGFVPAGTGFRLRGR